MKMTINNLIGIVLFACIAVAGCKKSTKLLDDNDKTLYLDPSTSANIKVIDVFAGNTPALPTAPNALYTGPQLYVYANGGKLNGTTLGYINGNTYSSQTSTSPNSQGLPFPISNVYANVPPGATRFDIINARLNLTVVPNVPSFLAGDTLITFNTTLGAGKYYTMYIGDTVPTYKATILEDDFSAPPVYQTYKVRLANFTMDPLERLSLFSRRQNAEIITDIPHKNVSGWIQLSLPIISDTLELRKAGTGVTYITVQGTASQSPTFTPVGLRMYTIVARGKTGVLAKAPSASLIINR